MDDEQCYEAVSQAPSALVDEAWPNLGLRQARVAWGIYQQMTNAEIAAALGMNVGTVKSHVHVLLLKFNVRSRWMLRDVLRRDDTPWDVWLGD